MSKNVVIISTIVILLLIFGGWYLTRPKQQTPLETSQTQTPRPASTQTPTTSESIEEAMMEEKEGNIVKISASGFSPNNITIKVGESVTWENEDNEDHTVNSAPHPTHTTYPPLNQVGLIKPEGTKSLKFTQAGIYKYHDHLNPSLTGSVTVE